MTHISYLSSHSCKHKQKIANLLQSVFCRCIFIYLFFYLCFLNMNTVDYLDINILWKIQLLFSREDTFILVFSSFKS